MRCMASGDGRVGILFLTSDNFMFATFFLAPSISGNRARRMIFALLCCGFAGCSSVPDVPLGREAACSGDASATVQPSQAGASLRPASWADLPGWEDDDLSGVLSAFLQSCRALSGGARWPLWRATCEDAEKSRAYGADDSARLRQFFESRFQPYLLANPDGTTQGRVTGYYEPLLRGSRERSDVYAYPLLGVPPDLLTVDLSEVAPDLKSRRLRGRLQGRRIVPYFSRAEIVAREAAYADQVLFWIDDAVELFFLQIQGSGRIRLPDGSIVRVGYADQNGHPFNSIGNVLLQSGELGPERLSMQGIRAWARGNPEKLNAVLNANPSYVFFRELAGNVGENEGPIGALGVPLTPERSIAVDPRVVPLGAPVFLSTTYPASSKPLRRLMLAQDTGGAIRGAVRADFFWGFGNGPGSLAGKMKQQGQMWLLLPPAVASSWPN